MNNIHLHPCMVLLLLGLRALTCDEMSTRGQYYVYCQSSSQDFCGVTEAYELFQTLFGMGAYTESNNTLCGREAWPHKIAYYH